MFLLDTNVVSELRKSNFGKADRNVVSWAQRARPSDFYISVITVHELEVGVRLVERRDSHQAVALRLWLREQILVGFEGRILPVDTAVALLSAQLHVPDPRPLKDGLIAATALVHGMTVVTRNVGDFVGTGISVLNPWDV
jgi:predicted nucleic acid-binding protein